MSDELMIRLFKEAEKEFKRYWERGEYYYEQGNKEQANENFILGFKQFSNMIVFGYTEESYENETKIITLFSLYRLLEQMFASFYSKDYTHKTILAYLLINKQKIIESLNELQSSFNVEDIKRYQNICKAIKIPELAFRSREDLSEELEKVKNLIESTQPHKTSDETLKSLRISLMEISKRNLFPNFEKNSDNCFIATTAYSTAIHPDLDTFRNFRDQKLLTNFIGKHLVGYYYIIGPSIAQYVNTKPTLKKLLRQKLGQLANWMRSHQMD